MAQNAAVQGSEGHKKSFPPLDPSILPAPQLIWLAIAFGLLHPLLRRFILPRVGEIVEERGECIKRDLAQAEKLKTDTATALASYGQALADARAKASDVVKAFREKIATEVDQERMKAEAEIAAKLVEAEKRIAAAKAKGLADISDIAGDIAGAVVVRLIGEEVRKDEVERALSQEAAEYIHLRQVTASSASRGARNRRRSKRNGALMKLNGKVALITGAASGIGYAVAKRYLEVDGRVVIGDLSLDAAQRAAGTLGRREVGDRCRYGCRQRGSGQRRRRPSGRYIWEHRCSRIKRGHSDRAPD